MEAAEEIEATIVAVSGGGSDSDNDSISSVSDGKVCGSFGGSG